MEVRCWTCEAHIPEGQTYWSIQVTREKIYGDTVEVQAADGWLVLCEECAAGLNVAAGPDIEYESPDHESSHGQLSLRLSHDAEGSGPGIKDEGDQVSRPAENSPLVCPHCNNAIEPSDRFCMSCGGTIQ